MLVWAAQVIDGVTRWAVTSVTKRPWVKRIQYLSLGDDGRASSQLAGLTLLSEMTRIYIPATLRDLLRNMMDEFRSGSHHSNFPWCSFQLSVTNIMLLTCHVFTSYYSEIMHIFSIEIFSVHLQNYCYCEHDEWTWEKMSHKAVVYTKMILTTCDDIRHI